MSNIWIYVISLVFIRPARSFVSRFKNDNVGHYTQTFQPNYSIPAMHIGTISLYHCIPLPVTLTSVGGHIVSTEQNLLASLSHKLFNWMGWNLVCWWGKSSWTSWFCFWVRCIESWEHIFAVLLSVSNNFNVGMHLDIYDPIWFKLDTLINISELYILIIISVTWPWFRVTVMRESKNSYAIYCTKSRMDFDGMWYAIRICWSE